MLTKIQMQELEKRLKEDGFLKDGIINGITFMTLFDIIDEITEHPRGLNFVKDDFQTMLLNMPSPATSLPCVTCPQGIDCKVFETCDKMKGWREEEQAKEKENKNIATDFKGGYSKTPTDNISMKSPDYSSLYPNDGKKFVLRDEAIREINDGIYCCPSRKNTLVKFKKGEWIVRKDNNRTMFQIKDIILRGVLLYYAFQTTEDEDLHPTIIIDDNYRLASPEELQQNGITIDSND